MNQKAKGLAVAVATVAVLSEFYNIVEQRKEVNVQEEMMYFLGLFRSIERNIGGEAALSSVGK